MSGLGRAVIALLIFASSGCSTEETGLFQKPDAAEDPTSSPQGLDPDAGPPDTRPRPDKAPAPDLAAPDAPSVPDAPAPADVAPDLAPDKPPVTNQPVGASCNKDSECKGGHCVDGVCCESACGDACSACSQARTGRSDGTCARARDMEGKACGKACSSVATMPAVVEKVCSPTGACVVPSSGPKVLSNCHDTNPCVVAFCDDNEARCVKTTCPTQGTCCCRSSTGQRACTSRTQCTGSKMCE
jgi:hypothetical protein